MERKSQQILEANFDILRRRFPVLADRLAKRWDPSKVAVRNTPSGFPTLEVLATSGERILYHSGHDPRREATRWADAPQNRNASRVVLFGFGLGYHALALLAAAPREYLCIFEPRLDVFGAALETMDLSPLLGNPHVQLLCGESVETLYRTLLARMGEFLSTGFDFLALPSAARACPDEMKQTQKEIERVALAHKAMLRHMEQTGYQTQTHILRNIPAIYRAIPPSLVKGRMASRPALIVAAGPSLDKNIDQIPEAVGHAAIFAVDTSLRLLLSRGVEPHFVVTKDPSELNERHFEGIENLGRSVFVFDPQISPRLTERFHGPSIFLPHRCHSLHAHLPGRRLTEEDLLPFSQTVALAAFHLAHRMGCEPIVFVGLDLAFPPGSGRSHAGGTALAAEVSYTPRGDMVYRRPEGKQEFHEEVEMIPVPSVDGGTAPTSAAFYESIRYLEGILAQTKVLCIDATEGGARIQGTQILSLRETLNRHMNREFDPWDEVERLRGMPTPKIPEQLFQNLGAILEDAGEKARRELIAVTDLPADVDSDDLNRLLRRFQSVREKIEEKFRLYQILELALERLFVTIRAPDYFALRGDPSSCACSLERYVHYFGEIRRACATFGPMLRELDENRGQI